MQKKTGILLVNLGTPDSPNPRDVYRYLIEFLTDGRVIDVPWLTRQLLVRGMIVPSRYKQSAKSYQAIWTAEGSPLKVHGHRVRDGLQTRMGSEFHVEFAMRYQNPSIPSVLEKLSKMNLERLLIIPLFPQYASATTGSVHQKVMEVMSKWAVIPEVLFINQFSTHPGFIRSFCESASHFDRDDYDHFLFSFHGLPQRHIRKADACGRCLDTKDCCNKLTDHNRNCYSAQCYSTAYAIAEGLKLPPEKFSIAFQSRLGKDPWLQPYTSEVIADLAHKRMQRLLIFCPAFVCDCLETTYEIGTEYALEFKKAGGKRLDLVPGLNDNPSWIDTLKDIVNERLNIPASSSHR